MGKESSKKKQEDHTSLFNDSNLTPEEQTCVREKIKVLVEEGKSQDQAVAIAISMCAPSKVKGKAAAMATFSADKIKIRGGDYKAVDTGDGYFTVQDVPVMAEVSKGTKGAPYDVNKDVLEEFVKTAQERYHGERPFCATAFVGHNPDIPVTHPDFVGYVLPKRVDKYKFEDGDKWTVFADIKMNKAAFEKAKRGELPYTSPEVPWARRRISGLAFLDTQPPHFEFALFIPGDATPDIAAKFDAIADEEKNPMAKMDADTKVEEKKESGKDMESVVGNYVAKYMDENLPKHVEKSVSEYMSKNVLKRLAGNADESNKKPDALPAEPEGQKGGMNMSADPEMAAKFAAQADELAALKKRLDERESQEKAKALEEEAIAKMNGKLISEETKSFIAMFAKEGKEKLDKFMTALLKDAKDRPPRNMSEFLGGSSMPEGNFSSPVVQKYTDPEEMELAAKFSAQWSAIKKAPGGKSFTCSEDVFVKNEIIRYKSERDLQLNGQGR